MPDARPTVQMVNLGCAKNEVDAEEMLGVLQRDGYDIHPHRGSNGRADVVVINTCGFIEAAKRESVDAILEVVRRKHRGDVRKIVVAGCLAQRYARDLAGELPEVDAFIGTGQMGAISALVGESLVRPEQVLRVAGTPHHQWVEGRARVRTTAPWSAWLKISEGCDHRCSFCAIPSFRGGHVSKPIERIVAEAAGLAEQGARELNLIAQDSTQYGRDLYGRPMLPQLLSELSGVSDVRWLRLFYCYPSRVNAAVIDAIAGTPKVCQYIDMPLQHADDTVLRAMRRPGTGAGYLRLLERFRAASPDVAIRTTFIVGFPGETEEQFADLLRFVEAGRFDRVGAFEYSAEDGTPAATLPGRVPLRVRRARRNRLMELQQGISLDRNRAWIGREMEVLVESRAPSGGVNQAVGRTFRDAPELDGHITVHGTSAQPGDFIAVRVTDARPYDLIAVER